MQRSSSFSSQLVSQCVTRSGSCEAADLPSTTQQDEGQTRLPGSFDCLEQVQDTGVTPSPRPPTPLVLLPLQEPPRESLQESLKRRLKSSLGVRLSGSNYGEEQTVISISINKDDTLDAGVGVAEEEAEDEVEEEEEVGDGDSFTTAASNLSSANVCKICHCGEEAGEPKLITPCLCSGSLKFVHQDCLHRWIKSSDIKKCELCKFTFVMQSKVKPLNEWEKLDMSSLERRKLCCSITFHMVAITCVIWSLYVLIERTTHEIEEGDLQWPFWTKLIVVAIGFTGGLVFMYIQCKVYIQICRKWRAYNRTIVVQDLPQDIIQKQRKAIQDARKPGKEDAVWISSDSEGELNETSYVEETTPRSNSSQSSASTTTEHTVHAETQTQLRGITLQSALWQNGRAASTSSNTSDISVATISRLLEQMEGGGDGGGLVTVPAVIFFTESDTASRNIRSGVGGHSGLPGLPTHRSALAEPVLICDLPGPSSDPSLNLTSDTQETDQT